MKIAVVYPPLSYHGRYPLLSQNRIFTFTNSGVIKIYPLVLASAAVMPSRAGNDVLYKDVMNERISREQFMRELASFRPDMIVMETKADW